MREHAAHQLVQVVLPGPHPRAHRERSISTAAKLLGVVAGFLAGKDSDREGTDDLLSLAEGITAYAVRDNNQHGNIVDCLIAGLHLYREEMVAAGKITQFKE